MKVPADVKLPTAILVKTKARMKLDGMKRHGECYSDLILRILEEVELYREQVRFELMNKEIHE